MKLKLPKKFAEKDIDEFINKIYLNHKSSPLDKYYFNLTDVEFISNQELLLLSGLFKSFIESGIDFEVEFFKKGISTAQLKDRVKKQIIQVWEVWKIWKIVPINDYYKYFGIDGNSVEKLQKELDYYPKIAEMYTRHGVTPFVILEYLNNYNEVEVQKIIEPIYSLNSVINQLLLNNNCNHPFTSNSLSAIITEELYLNFLDHSLESSLLGLKKYAFMSISFQPKLDEMIYSGKSIQKKNELNFQTECIVETENFFYDSKLKKYRNNPYIQFSFLDFGQGIVETLRDEYSRLWIKNDDDNLDSEILRYAFNHDSSRHPIWEDHSNTEKVIPRGLFDVLTIVRRYKGLLIVRSNYGKILFDFSISNDINKAFSYFGNNKLYFPGTLLSLYLPAIEDVSKINISSIKPEITFTKVKPEFKKYVSINTIARKLKTDKNILYSALLIELRNEICSYKDSTLAFLSFKGCQWIEARIIKKTLFFLLTDYEINNFNNVVIINAPPKHIVDEVAFEILALSDALKNYKIHPLPIVEFIEAKSTVNIEWLGVYNNQDKIKLNDLLFEEYSIAKSDFNEPSNILGQLNEFDKYGNLLSNFPNKSELLDFYNKSDLETSSSEIENLLNYYNCIKIDSKTSLYLCNGNYYQREYVELNNLLNSKQDCNSITFLLFDRLQKKLGNLENYKFIGITTPSHKIFKSFESQNLISKDDYISLDNYLTFETDLTNDVIDASKKYILICDVISSGRLTQRLSVKLNELGTSLECVAVIVSILTPSFVHTIPFLKQFGDKLISLSEHPIEKFNRKDISNEVINKDIIRINPHTNIPIALSIKETSYDESIIFPTSITYNSLSNEITITNKFLDSINPKSINIGFLKFNNVIHPYFINTNLFLYEINETILFEIFEKINKPGLNTEEIKLFYPRKSGIESLDFNLVKKILANQLIEEIEIERFETPEGWRFPHNTDYFSAKIENKICLILDDGSCSGDTLIQMIDEISFYNTKEIILLCFIGRVNDHKREFFSRLSFIKVKNKKSIPLSIFFVCHWHIPTYYLDENPNIKETIWLKEIINIQNTPQSIRAIARTIIKFLKPRKREIDFEDYKYLPTCKDSFEIPKKDLLLIREEIGKVVGYRLYRESFKFFDYFIKKYETQIKTQNRYKEIELLCGCIIYEPYLYEKIVGVLPDIVEKIEDFVRVLIFSFKKIANDLTYQWDKKDIIHLFFIVFKNKKLINELSIDKFISMIEFTKPKESALDYILYKLLYYFYITNNEFNKYSSEIKGILLSVSDSDNLSPNAKAKIKIYRWFISSLPSSNTFQDLQSKLKANFEKIVDQHYHDDNIFNDKQIISSLLLEIGNKIRKGLSYENEVIIIKNHWTNIASFVRDILTFSSSFPRFFIDEKILFDLENNENSLRKIFGDLTEAIYNEAYKIDDISNKLNELFIRFILDKSITLKIFSNPYSKNVIQKIEESLRPEIIKFNKSLVHFPQNTNLILDFPQYFLDIILHELFSNFRHGNLEKELKIYISITQNDFLKVKIWNYIKEDLNGKGGNNGMKILGKLNNENLKAYYKRFLRNNNHLQIIKIKII